MKDGAIYTSAGVTASMDLALALIEEDHGRALALRIANVRKPRDTGSETQCGLERFRQTRTQIGAHLEPVDDRIDAVFAPRIEIGYLIQFDDLAVDARPDVAARLQVGDHFRMFALAIGDHRCEQHQRCAFRMIERRIHHFADRLRDQVDVVFGAARRSGRASRSIPRPGFVTPITPRPRVFARTRPQGDLSFRSRLVN